MRKSQVDLSAAFWFNRDVVCTKPEEDFFYVGPTGGFLISFPIMAYIIGLGVEHRDAFKGAFPVAVVVGTVVNYIVGVILFVIVAHSTVSVAVSACVLPFIPTAIIKAVLACVLGLNIRKRIPGVKKA